MSNEALPVGREPEVLVALLEEAPNNDPVQSLGKAPRRAPIGLAMQSVLGCDSEGATGHVHDIEDLEGGRAGEAYDPQRGNVN